MTTDQTIDGVEQYESINEFALAGEFGFLRVEGPFACEKEGTLWTISIPTGGDDHGRPNDFTLRSLRDSEGKAGIIIADGKAVGGGLVDTTHEPEGEGVLHVVIDQYAQGGS